MYILFKTLKSSLTNEWMFVHSCFSFVLFQLFPWHSIQRRVQLFKRRSLWEAPTSPPNTAVADGEEADWDRLRSNDDWAVLLGSRRTPLNGGCMQVEYVPRYSQVLACTANWRPVRCDADRTEECWTPVRPTVHSFIHPFVRWTEWMGLYNKATCRAVKHYSLVIRLESVR